MKAQLIATVLFIIASSARADSVATSTTSDSQFVSDLRQNICEPQAPETDNEKIARIKAELAFFRSISSSEVSYNLNDPCDSEAMCTFQISRFQYNIKDYQTRIADYQRNLAEIQKKLEGYQVLQKNGSLPSDQCHELTQNAEYLQDDSQQVRTQVQQLQHQLAVLKAKKSSSKWEIDGVKSDLNAYQTTLTSRQTYFTWLHKGCKGILTNNPNFDSIGFSSPSDVQSVKDDLDQLQKVVQGLTQKIEDAKARQEKIKNQPPAAPDSLEKLQADLKPYETRYGGWSKQMCGLSVAEAYVMNDYTGNGYMRVNPEVRGTWGGIRRGHKKLAERAYMAILNAGLQKIKPYDGIVWRGTTFRPDVLSKMQKGRYLNFSTVVSTGLFHGFQRAVTLKIHSTRGRYIAPLSANSGEEEVLFPGPARFLVTDRQQDSWTGNIVITLEEVPPVSFLPTDYKEIVRKKVEGAGLGYE